MSNDPTKVLLKGVPPYDGEYEIDAERGFDGWEWRFIKAISSYMPNTIIDGLRGGDPDIYISLAVIGLYRAGKVDETNWQRAADVLLAQPFQTEGGAITVLFPEEETEVPLGLTGEPEQPSLKSLPENRTSSGADSTRSSETSDATQPVTGITESGMWHTSGQEKSDDSPLPTSLVV